MGVYIKGMEMPKSCYDCDFAYQDQDGEHNVYWTCAAVHKSACMYERRDDCPLVSVPPHGRLIDTDAVSLEGGPYEYDEWCKWALEQYQDAPTVIEAEEGDG